MLIAPPALRPGDTVALVSLSWGGAAALPARYDQGVRQLSETFGLTAVAAPHALADATWLRSHPEARAADLHWALENPDVQGIISIIGGNDSIRTVPYLDLDLIARHPKVFTGYSDTTIQHLVHRKAGVGSFYGMALMTNAAEAGGICEFTADSFRHIAMTAVPAGRIEASESWTEEFLDWRDETNLARPRTFVPNYGWSWITTGAEQPGSATDAGDAPVVEGPLIGGCLEVLDMARGTEIWPELEAFSGAVLHLEISEERPSIEQVRHWLRGFTAMGITERISALLFSRPEEYTLRDTLRLYEAVRVELVEAGRPELLFVANLDYGHSTPMGVLPLGRRIRIDPNQRTMELTEAAVV